MILLHDFLLLSGTGLIEPQTGFIWTQCECISQPQHHVTTGPSLESLSSACRMILLQGVLQSQVDWTQTLMFEAIPAATCSLYFLHAAVALILVIPICYSTIKSRRSLIKTTLATSKFRPAEPGY